MKILSGVAILLAITLLVTATEATGSVAPVVDRQANVATGIPLSAISLQSLAALPQAGRPGTIDLVLGERNVTLELVPHSVRAPDFRVMVIGSDGVKRAVTAPPPATWRGTVAGEPGSRVLMSQVRGQLQGSVLLPGRGDAETQWWTIMPAAGLTGAGDSALTAVFREEDLPPSEATCGIEEIEAPSSAAPAPGNEIRARRSPSEAAVLRLACDTDLEFYVANGSSVPATVADIEAVVNGASDLYELDLQTIVQIGDIIVRTVDPDPYTTTNPTALLVQERTEWTANHGDIVRNAVQLFTGRDLDGTAVGIAFSDAVICGNYNNYSVVQSRYTTVSANRFALSAHELGHNCDGVHCDYMDFICRVMCPSIGGCSAGIRSFGPWEVARIGSRLASLSCLGTAELDLPHATLPFTEAFTAASLDPAKWTAVDQASVSTGRLALNHGGGYSPSFYLGTVRTLPIVVPGRVDISYKVRPSGVTAGQRLKVEYFDTATRAWLLLNTIVAPGGTPADYTTWTHTTPPEAAGDLFCLRFSAYGDAGSTSSDWLVDDVAIAASMSAVPGEALPTALLRGVWPNPFNPGTTIRFDLPEAGAVRLSVFDVAGRLVRALLDENMPQGNHEAAWDGRDASGRDVGSGSYLARLEFGGKVESVTMGLVR
jgi:hypothetical protein